MESASCPWGFPSEISEYIFTFCDLPSKGAVQQVCKNFNRIILNSDAPELKAFCLAKGAKQIDAQLRANSAGNFFIISDEEPQDPATTLIKQIQLLNFADKSEQLSESVELLIDALCDLDDEPLERLQADQLPKKIPFAEFLKKAKNRYKGDLFLYPNAVHVVGEKPIDTHGREHGNYGCGEGWHVSFECWITNRKKENWSRHSSEIDEYLPVKLFLGKREGDSVTFPLNGKEVKLICKQQAYRYGEINFEDLCLRVINVGGVWFPSKPSDPTREEQKKMIEEMLDTYKKSLG